MQTIRFICTAAVALTFSSFAASAQMQRPDRPEGMPGPEHHQMSLTPRQRAEQRTDEMDKAVRLDDKQYKKIYKIFLKEENAKETAMGNGGPMGMPPGGMGGGRPPQGGGFQGGPAMGGGSLVDREVLVPVVRRQECLSRVTSASRRNRQWAERKSTVMNT